MNIISLGDHPLLDIPDELLVKSQKEFIYLLNRLTEWEPIAGRLLFNMNQEPSSEIPRLFGTSGIRGIYEPRYISNPLDLFIQENKLTPLLVYFLGRSVGQLLMESGEALNAWVLMDVRNSSLPLAMAMIKGLTDQSVSVFFAGIAPTPCHAMHSTVLNVIITASHNPIEYNGVKLYRNGRPLVHDDERRIEQLITIQSQLADHAKTLKPNESPGNWTNAIAEFERDYFVHLHNLPETGKLRLQSERRFSTRFLPLDLAYGAAACPMSKGGTIARISPSLAVLLSLGLPVIGYGCTQDPIKTNKQIGAAYAYGETHDTPSIGEISHFSMGLTGYGTPAPRVVFLPIGWVDRHRKRLDLIRLHQSDLQTLSIGFPDFRTDILIIHLDDPALPFGLATQIESIFMRRKPLPGLMVDCDADRILITTPELASQQIPYLTGDGMIRFFVETSDPEKLSHVVYTVESGMSLEIALHRWIKKINPLRKNPPITIQSVNVGDRSIIDYMLAHSTGMIIGGEPSGHIVFAAETRSGFRITDDPLITYQKLLGCSLNERFDLSKSVSLMFHRIPEVYCARKGIPIAGNIALSKRSLELWESGKIGKLSTYARQFIPEYVRMFGDAYGQAFHDHAFPEITFTNDWHALLGESFSFINSSFNLPIAFLDYQNFSGEPEILQATLYLTQDTWAGPEVIRIGFWLFSDHGQYKMGEGVFRNSGTSPKNSAYHKLWPHHPLKKLFLTEGRLREILDELAEKRNDWTDNFLRRYLDELPSHHRLPE